MRAAVPPSGVSCKKAERESHAVKEKIRTKKILTKMRHLIKITLSFKSGADSPQVNALKGKGRLMEAKAVLRHVRMSAQKARLVADLVRGRKVGDALNILRFTKKKMARLIEKVIASAKANAENNHNVADGNDMKVARIFVDAGPQMRRQLSRARGRVDQLRKPMAHVTVVLTESAEGRRKAAPKKAADKKGAAPDKTAVVAEKPEKTEKPEKKAAAKKTAVKKTKKDKES